MTEIKDKLVIVESLENLHKHNKKTYATKNELSSAHTNIDMLNSRIDTLIPDYEGDGYEEIADIRVGYDGTAYSKAGNAIRTQISNVVNDIKNLTQGMVLTTDNLIDTRIADDWNQGTIDDSTDVVNVVSNAIRISGKTIYFGGISSGNISSISIYSFTEEGTQISSKMVLLSDTKWKNNSMYISSATSYIIVEIRIASGYGGITPTLLATIAPKLFVSETMQTEDSFYYSTKLANMESLVSDVKDNSNNIEATANRVENLEENTGTLKTWKQTLSSTPQFMHVETTEAKCMCTYDKYLYVCGGYRFEQWDISCEFAPKLVAKAYPLSGLNMRAYQMAITNDGAYIYMAARLTSPGYTGEEFAGGLFIMDTSTLEIVNRIEYNAKTSGVEMSADETLMAVNLQVGGLVFYDIGNDRVNPVQLYEHREEDGQITNEYQRGEFVAIDDCLYYIVAGFSDGIRIWDCTNKDNISLVSFVSIVENMGLDGAHVFDVTINYPYVYATIAPWTNLVNTEGAYYGLEVLDISDMSNILTKFIPIDAEDINMYGASDPKPCEIERIGTRLILNNGDKGVAIYTIEDGANPIYRGCVPCGGEEAHGLHVTRDGRLFVGNAFVEPFKVRMFRGV